MDRAKRTELGTVWLPSILAELSFTFTGTVPDSYTQAVIHSTRDRLDIPLDLFLADEDLGDVVVKGWGGVEQESLLVDSGSEITPR